MFDEYFYNCWSKIRRNREQGDPCLMQISQRAPERSYGEYGEQKEFCFSAAEKGTI